MTGPGGIDWAALSVADVTRFVMTACSGRGTVPSSSLLAALRSFLPFAQREGWTLLPLARAVPSVARWSAGSLPRRLEPNESSSSWPGATEGAPSRRDYAILAWLVRMGLLAVEVTRLQLEDIDWRVGNLVVCGKARWTETLPLPTNVGTLLPPTSRHSSDSPERRCPVRLSQ